ncbi:hypothetical protein ABXV17_08880 [Vibrio harveyi]
MKLGKVTSIFQKKDIALAASSANSNTFDRDGFITIESRADTISNVVL